MLKKTCCCFSLNDKQTIPIKLGVQKYANDFVVICGQSYKASSLINYNSRVVSISNLLVIMTLEL